MGEERGAVAPATLPAWRRVLAVVAHPDDESFGLGALLSAFADCGAAVGVLCLTRGEGSTLHGVEGDLSALRAGELAAAAAELGGDVTVTLRTYPDGGLAALDPRVLADEVRRAVADHGADGLLVFSPGGITGHPDHQAATGAALAVAEETDLGVLAWGLPEPVAAQLRDELAVGFVGCPEDVEMTAIHVDRTRQFRAIACHASQAVPGSALWRRLEVLGDVEYVRWLRPPPT